MGRLNKTQRQRSELKLRYAKVDVYKQDLERLIQDNNYYNNVLKKENKPHEVLNIKEIINARNQNENYIRFLKTKIERIEKI